MPVSEQVLHQCPVHPGHPSVMDCEPVREEVLQLQVLDLLGLCPQHLHRGRALLQEPAQGVLLQALVPK